MIPVLFQLLKKAGLPLLLVIGMLYLTRVWIPGISHTYVTSLLFFSLGGYFAIKSVMWFYFAISIKLSWLQQEYYSWLLLQF